MNALTAVKPTPAPVAQQYPGFSFTPSAQSPRLLELTFSAETTTQFLQQVAQWPVQALEYKSFLRFQVGKILDDLCGNQLQPLLIKTLLDRAEGALETSKNILSIPVPVGKFLLINNLFWLHGRDRFTPHPDLRRELMRQRGYFAYSTNHYQTHQ
ncbi:TPA: carbon starvation induced protein CsiD [Klebsiella pneumoniae]